MVKEAVHKCGQEVNLVNDVVEKINTPPISSFLFSHYPLETAQLLKKLNDLEQQAKANNLPDLMEAVNSYLQASDQFQKLSEVDREIATTFFKRLLEDFQSIQENCLAHKVSISCALDGFTLNRTCRLIDALNNFISQQDPKRGFLEPKDKVTSTNFYKLAKDNKLSQYELAVSLKHDFETLRTQIGSQEPRGLVVTLLCYLTDAVNSCQETTDSTSITELVDCLNQAIEDIKNQHPDLAQAVEEVQIAIANIQLQNS